MIAYMKIGCGYCGQAWEVYDRNDYEGKVARTCPHCGSKIDGQTWKDYCVPAMEAVRNANKELANDEVNYHAPRFTVSVISDSLLNG